MKLQDIKKQANSVYDEDDTDEYKNFTDKFKPKKTTDDCFTPDNVYETVADYVATRFNVDRNRFVRPFYPGGDYQSYTYKPDSIVVDNPPFSILAQIVKWYQSQGIKFFLFAPGLTIIGLTRHANIICVGYNATYENGAKVNTSFVTNMTDNLIESSSKLYKRLENADKENLRKIKKKQLPKYTYPDNILTACRMNTLSRYGVDFAIKRENGHFMRDLDSQRKFKKGIFGCGYLISGKKAAELKAAELKAAELKAAEHVWELSEREKEIIKTLK